MSQGEVLLTSRTFEPPESVLSIIEMLSLYDGETTYLSISPPIAPLPVLIVSAYISASKSFELEIVGFEGCVADDDSSAF